MAVVAASYGLGTSFVSGERAPTRIESIAIDASWNVSSSRSDSPPPARSRRASNASVPTHDAHRPALTDDEYVRSRRWHGRQDTPSVAPGHRSAVEDSCLYLLQARPITAPLGMIDPDGTLSLYNDRNIAKSYAGVTTPLTFSFARRAYERSTASSATHPRARRQHRRPPRHLPPHAGLIRGRVLYDLLSWFRVLALLPGMH